MSTFFTYIAKIFTILCFIAVVGCDDSTDNNNDSTHTTTEGSSETASSIDAGAAQSASASDGPGGFLWKPVSETTGNVVILFPASLTGSIKSVEIHYGGGQVKVATFSSVANGGREHYRANMPGAGFGTNINVVMQKHDGTVLTYLIPNGASRVD